MMKTMRMENRQSPRIAKQLFGHAERVATELAAGQDRELAIRVVDVSREGIAFLAPEPFDRDAFVRLRLDVDAFTGTASRGGHFTTSCVVRDCAARPDGIFHVGAKLKEQTGRELETWLDLVQRWSPKLL